MDNFYTQCVWFYTQYVKLDTVNSHGWVQICYFYVPIMDNFLAFQIKTYEGTIHMTSIISSAWVSVAMSVNFELSYFFHIPGWAQICFFNVPIMDLLAF